MKATAMLQMQSAAAKPETHAGVAVRDEHLMHCIRQMQLKAARAESVRTLLTSGVRAGEGASSRSFWLRRWMEQSRSPKCTQLPCWSASTCAPAK